MKRTDKHTWMDLLEGLGEILLTVLCLGIGIFIIDLFGVDFESLDMDYDVIILIGLVVFFPVFGCASAFVEWIKKIIRRLYKK